jgi:hypothetical protein
MDDGSAVDGRRWRTREDLMNHNLHRTLSEVPILNKVHRLRVLTILLVWLEDYTL